MFDLDRERIVPPPGRSPENSGLLWKTSAILIVICLAVADLSSSKKRPSHNTISKDFMRGSMLRRYRARCSTQQCSMT